jgi:valyl-tRNA synthetase
VHNNVISENFRILGYDYQGFSFYSNNVEKNVNSFSTALYEDKIKAYKLFANKIWNISRFVFENTEETDGEVPLTDTDTQRLTELHDTIAEVTREIDEYRFYLAGEKLYHYVWHTFADAILEESKPILKGEDERAKRSRQWLLHEILTQSLKMLHPFMPFITEEIWCSMEGTKNMLIVEPWPSK